MNLYSILFMPILHKSNSISQRFAHWASIFFSFKITNNLENGFCNWPCWLEFSSSSVATSYPLWCVATETPISGLHAPDSSKWLCFVEKLLSFPHKSNLRLLNLSLQYLILHILKEERVFSTILEYQQIHLDHQLQWLAHLVYWKFE